MEMGNLSRLDEEMQKWDVDALPERFGDPNIAAAGAVDREVYV